MAAMATCLARNVGQEILATSCFDKCDLQLGIPDLVGSLVLMASSQSRQWQSFDMPGKKSHSMIFLIAET
ncbi:hypothetical protein NL676_030552 [Syzygium grande]|nr:hypothetical protein NL676_030552 [Syzygium grande]